MVINIRGTHGSGKSTIVRTVMSSYEERKPMIVAGRKRPIGYLCARPGAASLYVVGHYENACGGGDTVLSVDEAYRYIVEAAAQRYDVLFEGILLGHDVRRCADLKTAYHFDVLVIALTTDLDTCMTAVRARRVARGDFRELKPDNVFKGRNSYLIHQPRRFKEAGVECLLLDREAALWKCLERLGLATDNLSAVPPPERTPAAHVPSLFDEEIA